MNIKHLVKSNLPGLFRLLSTGKRAITNARVREQSKTLVAKIQDLHKDRADAREIIEYIKAGKLEMMPYFFTDAYRSMEVKVTTDQATGLKFVVLNGRKVYFPGSFSDDYIVDSVRVGLMEQDPRSPHRYLPANGVEISGDIAVVCGASDSIYTLSIIDKFRKIYLFEANTDWVPAIKATLKGYEEKYEIVPYYISDSDTKETVQLDTFFKNVKGKVNYIQADIEGMEINMLRGAAGILQGTNSLDLAICCYHSKEQEAELTDFLVKAGYTVRPTEGYLLLWMQYPLLPPYLRRGVLYAQRRQA